MDKDNINKQINLLLEEAKKIKHDIDLMSKDYAMKIEVLDKKIDDSIVDIEKLYSELDQIDEAAGTAIDELVLEQAKVLTED